MHIQSVLPPDTIPSIDDPSFGGEFIGDGDDDVIVVEDDPPRAYPVRILSYHEIVNDVLENEQRPIAVTWCPICASAIVYDRTVDGQVLTFGTSGKLADDALVMYDRETGSEWKQPLGRAISGPLEGHELAVIAAPLMTWERFRTEYPDGLVLQPVHGRGDGPPGQPPRAAYDMTRYDQYAAAEEFGLRAMRGEGRERSWNREDIDAKTVVLGIVHGGDAIAYPVPRVRDEGGIVSDTIGDQDVIVVSSGTEIHAFEDPGYEFELRDGTLYGDGVTWDVTTGRSSDGRTLSRIPARRLYAFAWQDDHGRESFYGLD